MQQGCARGKKVFTGGPNLVYSHGVKPPQDP
jgi:hypothetical protein